MRLDHSPPWKLWSQDLENHLGMYDLRFSGMAILGVGRRGGYQTHQSRVRRPVSSLHNDFILNVALVSVTMLASMLSTPPMYVKIR